MSWTLSSGIGFRWDHRHLPETTRFRGTSRSPGGGGSSSSRTAANGGSLTLAGNMTNEPAAAADGTAFLKGAASGTILGPSPTPVRSTCQSQNLMPAPGSSPGPTRSSEPAPPIDGGTLQFSGVNGASGGSTAYTLGGGGALALANTFAANNTNRIADTATLTTNGTAGINFTRQRHGGELLRNRG